MADEKTSQNPQTESDAPESDSPTLVGSDGLLNLEVIADESLKEAAKSLNTVVTERLNALKARETEAEAALEDAKNYRLLASDPRAVKRLHDELFPSTEKPAPVSEKEDEMELSDDAIVDAPTLKKLAKSLAAQTNQSIAAATKQIKDELLAEFKPTAERVKIGERQAKWAEVVARYPEADSKEYREEIAKVLGTKRVGLDDFEAAFLIVDANKRRKREADKKATDTVSKAKAAAAASEAQPKGRRVASSDVSTKGRGWVGAVQAAKEKIGAGK